MNPIDWQAAAVVMSFLAALCGRPKVRTTKAPRHQRGSVKLTGRSVMSIRTRILREYRIAVPTLYLSTRGTLAPETPTLPLRDPISPMNTVQFQSPDIELMQRVLNGLRKLPVQQPGN